MPEDALTRPMGGCCSRRIVARPPPSRDGLGFSQDAIFQFAIRQGERVRLGPNPRVNLGTHALAEHVAAPAFQQERQ